MPRYRAHQSFPEVFFSFVGLGPIAVIFIGAYALSQLPQLTVGLIGQSVKERQIERRCREEGPHSTLCKQVFSQQPLKGYEDNPFKTAGDPASKADCAENGANATSFCVREADGTYVAWWEATAARPYIQEFCAEAQKPYLTCGFSTGQTAIEPWWETDTSRNHDMSLQLEIEFERCIQRGLNSHLCPMGANGYLVPWWATAKREQQVIEDCASTVTPLVYCYQASPGEFVPYWEHYGFREVDVSSNEYRRAQARKVFAECAAQREPSSRCRPGPHGALIPYWATDEFRNHMRKKFPDAPCTFSKAGSKDCRKDAQGNFVDYTLIDPQYGPF